MNKRILLFATKNDMICILNSFQKLLSFDIKYVKAGNIPDNQPEVFFDAAEIPHLGFLKTDKHCTENYIILKKDISIVTKEINSQNRGVIHVVYDSMNDTCMSFSPSGFNSTGDCLIHGQFAIINENDTSKEMMKIIKKALKNNCITVRGWYIGHEAEQLNGKVRFITIGVNEPIEYDFTY